MSRRLQKRGTGLTAAHLRSRLVPTRAKCCASRADLRTLLAIRPPSLRARALEGRWASSFATARSKTCCSASHPASAMLPPPSSARSRLRQRGNSVAAASRWLANAQPCSPSPHLLSPTLRHLRISPSCSSRHPRSATLPSTACASCSKNARQSCYASLSTPSTTPAALNKPRPVLQ